MKGRDMTTYFTSDLHMYHTNVIRYCDRPFFSVEEMNETMIANWNSVVQPEDTIYCLGDFSLAIRPVELFTRRLNGIKKLIPGNHDWCHPGHKKGKKELEKWRQFYLDQGWDEILPISSLLTLKNGQEVRLSHMPHTTIQPKYAEFIPKDDGKWLICGHIHQHWTVSGNQINVGVDRFGMTPVSEDEVVKLIGQGVQPFHQSHHEEV